MRSKTAELIVNGLMRNRFGEGWKEIETGLFRFHAFTDGMYLLIDRSPSRPNHDMNSVTVNDYEDSYWGVKAVWKDGVLELREVLPSAFDDGPEDMIRQESERQLRCLRFITDDSGPEDIIGYDESLDAYIAHIESV